MKPSHWIQNFPFNAQGRDFIVGDIHGCFDELLRLLAHARFNPHRDRLFSVGDLIDRGVQSADALNLLRKPWFFSVRGNHEQMLLDHWAAAEQTPAFDPRWLSDVHPDTISYWQHRLSKLPLIIKVGQGPSAFYIMHAELWDNRQPLTAELIDQARFDDLEQAQARLLWGRHIISSHWRESDRRFHAPLLNRIFCGHTIVQVPMQVEKSVYLDTGAFAPYVDPVHAVAEHYGLSLVEAHTLRHYFAPTNAQYRGTVVDMGPITAELSAPDIDLNAIQPQIEIDPGL